MFNALPLFSSKVLGNISSQQPREGPGRFGTTQNVPFLKICHDLICLMTPMKIPTHRAGPDYCLTKSFHRGLCSDSADCDLNAGWSKHKDGQYLKRKICHMGLDRL